jgi:DNA polymerase III delta subunit
MPKTMIIYLYGSDSYRRQQKLKEIIQKYREKHSNLTIDRFYFDEEGEFLRFKDFSSNQSLFGGSKMGIIYNLASANKQKELIDLIKKFLDSDCLNLLISEEKELDKEFDFLHKKPVLVQNFKTLSPLETINFIKTEAQKKKIELSIQTIDYLMKTCGSDTWGLLNELNKLSLGGKIESQYHYEKNDLFFLIDKIVKSPSIDSRLKTLEILLDNEEPAMIFNFVASISRNPLKIKMADYDAMIKSGKLNYEEALLDLVISH